MNTINSKPSAKPVFDKNNVENGIWLPEHLRIYVDKYRYLHKYSSIGLAYKASQTLLKI